LLRIDQWAILERNLFVINGIGWANSDAMPTQAAYFGMNHDWSILLHLKDISSVANVRTRSTLYAGIPVDRDLWHAHSSLMTVLFAQQEIRDGLQCVFDSFWVELVALGTAATAFRKIAGGAELFEVT
jgi:hypothetical protein